MSLMSKGSGSAIRNEVRDKLRAEMEIVLKENGVNYLKTSEYVYQEYCDWLQNNPDLKEDNSSATYFYLNMLPSVTWNRFKNT